MTAKGPESAPEAPDADWMTRNTLDHRKTRYRALFARIFLEAGVELEDRIFERVVDAAFAEVVWIGRR
jgi:hypothetical protein